MKIPHVETIREHRETIAAAAGAQPLLIEVQQLLTRLGLARRHEEDSLPGGDLLERLVARPGLEGLAAVDANSGPDWTSRVQARELAMRSAEAMLRPQADDAHRASHAIHDLRKEQLAAIHEQGDEGLRTRVAEVMNASATANAAVRGPAQRLQYLDPAKNLLATYTEQLERALASTAPIRDALVDAFAQSALEGSRSTLADLGFADAVEDTGPEGILEQLAQWTKRVLELEAELNREVEDRQRSAHAAWQAVMDLLG